MMIEFISNMLEALAHYMTVLHQQFDRILPYAFALQLHRLLPYMREILLITIGFPFIWHMSNQIKKTLRHHTSAHVAGLLSAIFFYTASILLFVTILHQMNFQLSALLGAAGILGIAIGFAAQTTVSNVISGIFLLMEQNFSIGDFIEIDNQSGTIESIDLLSIKIRTVENQFIRIPNEMLIKQPVTNLSFFQTRRIQCIFEIGLQDDIAKSYEIINAIIKDEKTVLQNPAPLIYPHQYAQSSIVIYAKFWIKKEDIKSVFTNVATTCQELNKKNNTMISVRFDK